MKIQLLSVSNGNLFLKDFAINMNNLGIDVPTGLTEFDHPNPDNSSSYRGVEIKRKAKEFRVGMNSESGKIVMLIGKGKRVKVRSVGNTKKKQTLVELVREAVTYFNI